MSPEDSFILITHHLLKAPPPAFEKAQTELKPIFSHYELHTPRRPHAFSVAGESAQPAATLGFWDWINMLRDQGYCLTNQIRHDSEAGIPAHIAAAFANGCPKVIELSSPTLILQFAPEIHFARSTALTGPELAHLIDAQFSDSRSQEELWSEVFVKDVRRYGEYMDSQDWKDAQKFLQEDYEKYFCPANELLRTVQHFCARRKSEFKIPAHLQDKLSVRGKSFEILIGDPYEPYFSATPRAEVLVEWIEAQPEAARKWQLIAEDFLRLLDPEHRLAKALAAQQSPQEIRQSFAQMTVEELSQLPLGNISMVLGRGFVIPENLRRHFTFPERPPIEDAELWIARENPEPWQMLLFRLLSHRAPSSSPGAASGSSPDLALQTSTLESELPEFRRALREIADFAQRQASAFEEAFRLSLWILDQPTHKVTAQQLRQEGFSEIADQAIERSHTPHLLTALQVPSEIIRLCLALDLADQFGGMGSWNDQSFASAEDQAEYDRVSQQLFAQISKLRELLLH